MLVVIITSSFTTTITVIITTIHYCIQKIFYVHSHFLSVMLSLLLLLSLLKKIFRISLFTAHTQLQHINQLLIINQSVYITNQKEEERELLKKNLVKEDIVKCKEREREIKKSLIQKQFFFAESIGYFLNILLYSYSVYNKKK